MWQEIIDLLDKNRPWLVAGNYNMVESLEDKKRGFGKILRELE